MQHHEATRAYVARRTTEGRTKAEIIRCLKRFLAREIWALMRPLRSGPQPSRRPLDRHRSINAESRELVDRCGLEAHIVSRRAEINQRLRTPGWRARRWVVEAAHSWLNRNRALLIRWSKKAENHLALLQRACGLIAFKKAHAARLAAALRG